MFFLLLLCVLFSGTLSTCPPGSDEIPHTDKCVIVEQTPTKSGYFEAQLSCIAAGGNLMSVGNAFTNTMLLAYTIQYPVNGTYVFLGADNHSQRTWKWIDGSNMTFVHWAPGQPTERGDCAAMSVADGLWYSVGCVEALPYFCEVPQQNQNVCQPGWINFSDACYFIYDSPKYFNFTQADAFCQFNDANLASIHDAEENQFLVARLNASIKCYWIGLHDNGTTHLWTDGSPVTFLNTTAPPVDLTVYFLSSAGGYRGRWDSLDNRSNVRGLICKKALNATSTHNQRTNRNGQSPEKEGISKEGQHFFIQHQLHTTTIFTTSTATRGEFEESPRTDLKK